MGIQIEVDSVQFDSYDGVSRVQGYIWRPEDESNVRGIVQLVHGMAEYIMRYDDFARFLVGQGFIVCGHDHVGHGGSVNSKEQWGSIKMPNGNDVLVEDVHVARNHLTIEFDSCERHGNAFTSGFCDSMVGVLDMLRLVLKRLIREIDNFLIKLHLGHPEIVSLITHIADARGKIQPCFIAVQNRPVG